LSYPGPHTHTHIYIYSIYVCIYQWLAV